MRLRSRAKALEALEYLDEYAEEIEHDLWFFYGVDIYDVLAGELSPRRVVNFLRYAPSKGAFKAALRGGIEHYEWDEQQFALVSLLETFRFHRHEFLMANMSKEKAQKVKTPEPLPMPGRKLPNKDKQSNGGFAAMLAAEKEYQSKLAEEQNG